MWVQQGSGTKALSVGQKLQQDFLWRSVIPRPQNTQEQWQCPVPKACKAQQWDSIAVPPGGHCLACSSHALSGLGTQGMRWRGLTVHHSCHRPIHTRAQEPDPVSLPAAWCPPQWPLPGIPSPPGQKAPLDSAARISSCSDWGCLIKWQRKELHGKEAGTGPTNTSTLWGKGVHVGGIRDNHFLFKSNPT